MGELVSYLTFIEDAGRNSNGKLLGRYRCICGVEKTIVKGKVSGFLTKSCGCMYKSMLSAANSTHGLSKHHLFKIWNGVLSRCYKKYNKSYARYGAKGVRVCEEWRNDFKPFYDWAMANGWEKGLEVDKDIKGNGFLYSPNTCSIVTRIENANHKKNNRKILHQGVLKNISQLAREFEIPPANLRTRIDNGWKLDDALLLPKKKSHRAKMVICNNTLQKFKSATEAAKVMGLERSKISAACGNLIKSTKGYSFSFVNTKQEVNGIKHSFGYIG